MARRAILDVCCGSRMFWFDKNDDRVIFCDKRVEQHVLKDSSVSSGERSLVIHPDIQADFTALPFPSNYFRLVVFDPPHFEHAGKQSWLRKKYGVLDGEWRPMLRNGFLECFRVLIPGGVLIFKWSSMQIPVSDVLKLTEEIPLFGHRSGKHSLTHWVSFVKTAPCSSELVSVQECITTLFGMADAMNEKKWESVALAASSELKSFSPQTCHNHKT